MTSARWPRRIEAGLLALILVGLSFWLWQRYRGPSAPTYEGKTLNQWLAELNDADYGVSSAAADALGRIGAEAVPVLLDARETGDIRLHRRAAAVLVKIGAPAAPGLVGDLKEKATEPGIETILVRMGPAAVPALVEALPDKKRGKEAARILGLMRARAADAVPALVKVLKDGSGSAAAREEAAFALGRIGEPASDVVPALATALKDGKEKVRYRAAEALGWMGQSAKETLPALIAALKDEDDKVAGMACLALVRLSDAGAARALLEALQDPRGEVADHAGRALWQMGPAAKVVVPDLIAQLKRPPNETGRVRTLLLWQGPLAVPGLVDALHDNEASVRQSAAELLGLIGPLARPGVPALAEVLHDKTPAVALTAARALTRIDPTRAGDAVPLLMDSLDSAQAAEALADMGPEARAAVPALVAALKHRDKAVRASARRALACIGSPAVPALIDALKTLEVSALAAEALGAILPRPKEAVSALRDALQRDRAQAVVYARTLGALGPPAHDAIPDLKNLLTDAAARIEAAVALTRIDATQTAKAIPVLIEELKAADAKRRRAAMDALEGLGPASQPAVPALLALLREPDPDIALPVAEVLVRIGPAAIPNIAGLLQDPEMKFRQFAVSMLAEFGPAAKEALPGLLRALEDVDPLVRAGAAHAMEAIGPAAHDAVPTLIANLNASLDEIRFRSAVALGHIGQDAREARAPLLECLLDPNHQVRYAAALSLGRIDEKYVEAIPALRDALHDADPDVRLGAVDSLARIDKSSIPESVPVLLDLSGKPYYLNARLRAVEGMLELAPESAKKAMPLLAVELTDVAADVRLHAAALLERIEPEQTPSIVLALAGGLRDGNPAGRKLLAHGLGALGSKAREAVPALLCLLQDDVPAVRREAEKALRAIDPRKAAQLGLVAD